MMKELPDTFEMVTRYSRQPDGSVHERVTVGETVLYDGPARVVFVQFKPPLPWESPKVMVDGC